MVNYAVEIFAKIICVGMVLFQGLLLDGYLVKFHNPLWWLWTLVDGLLIISWTILLTVVWRAYQKREKRKLEGNDMIDGRDLTKFPDEIKHAYLIWIVYAVCLIPRVVILFRKDASSLNEDDILGPNYLKVAVSCTPLIFILLIYALHDAKQVAARKYFLASMLGSITLDLFDSIDLLEFLFEPEDQLFPRALLDCSLAFACINFFLPALALSEIRVNGFNGEVSSLPFNTIYKGCYVFLVNVPNLVIRSVLWHHYNADVSVLIMKNVMCICIGLSEIANYFTEDQPKECTKCKKWFEKEYFNAHFIKCKAIETSALNTEL